MNLKKNVQNLKEHWLTIAAVLILFLLFSGFNLNSLVYRSEASYDSQIAVGSTKEIYPYPGGGNIAPEVEERIKTFSSYLSLEIKRGSLDSISAKIKSEVENSQGFIINEYANNYENDYDSIKSGSFQIRVPIENYETVLTSLKKLGKVTSLSQESDDITSTVTNLEIELKAEEDRLNRYLELYNAAKTTEEKLSLSDKIFEQERRIAYLKESLNSQGERVDYASVYLTVQEKESPLQGVNFISFNEIIRSFIASISSLIRLVFVIIPYAVIIWLIWFIYKKNSKKK